MQQDARLAESATTATTASASSRSARSAATSGSPRPDGSPAAPPPGGGRRRRPDRHHRHLRAAARRGQPLFAAGLDDVPDALGRARHHRHRRGAADHRRRVRPLGRLDDRLRRRGHRPHRPPSRLPALGRHRLRLRGGDPRRLLQRADRGEDAAAVLHRHARLALHPARPVDRHHPRRHRPHPDPLHPRRRARSRHRQDLQRPPVHGLLPLDGRAGLDRHAQRRHALRARHPDVDRLVDRRHRRSPAGSSPRPASATGSTPPAATGRSRATSAFRSAG